MADPAYGMTVHLPNVSYEEARRRIEEALKAEGFGILTEIDVCQTLKQKLGVDFRRYSILGACNPQLAHGALQTEPYIGLLLPCNVVVAEEDGGAVVSILDPKAMFAVVENAALEAVAAEARERLGRALDSLKSTAGAA